jgi:TrmH family RNA methyltransferase
VLAAADEHGETDVFDADLTRPVLLLVGNETTGLTSAWRDLCDLTVKIPITGAASSLNAANAAAVVLYEIARQRLTTQGLTTQGLTTQGLTTQGQRRPGRVE